MIADVFKEQDFPIAKRLALRLRVGTDAIRGERHGLAQHLAKLCGHGRKAVFRIHFSFWPAEVRSEHETRASFDGKPQRGQCLADARVVGDAAAIERDVEIHADENALAAHFEIANGEFVHGRVKIRDWNRNSRTARRRI